VTIGAVNGWHLRFLRFLLLVVLRYSTASWHLRRALPALVRMEEKGNPDEAHAGRGRRSTDTCPHSFDPKEVSQSPCAPWPESMVFFIANFPSRSLDYMRYFGVNFVTVL
jgi:hypothetical protein